MKGLLQISLLLVILFQSCQRPEKIFTPAEKTKYAALTSGNDIQQFLIGINGRHNAITVENLSVSDSMNVPVVRFSNPERSNTDRLRIMLIAQQHGNEPSGMEGLLLLIRDLAEGKHDHWLQHADLTIIPQCNPYGGNKNKRRNAEGIDLNRDHLVLEAAETKLIQQVFDTFDPHFTVDFHEYYPFGKSWEEFGYRRNFDIQLGGPTNLNTSDEIRYAFKNRLLPYVEKQLNNRGFSFFEYTLGSLPEGERLRHSTTDIDDGRQSFAITGTFSLIVEGMNGRDSLDRLERRANSQLATAEALVSWAIQNRRDVMKMVEDARKNVATLPFPISIRQEHMPDGKPLNYPLLSLKSGKDTVFVVENYHPMVISNLDVNPPKGYLIPKNNLALMAWLKRNNYFTDAELPEGGKVFLYQITGFEESVDEEVNNQKALVEKRELEAFNPDDYVYLPLNQKYNLRLILALEPQSMYGLINYKNFETLHQAGIWPVLRLE
ncbi:MAG: succinylglutamate desuccinylase/aspartoacylase family protein [Bacteroidia bacterium]|nr:succinylglutamate desuccinylase/aspartoacylase family protein [Bacteroidia bacterium]